MTTFVFAVHVYKFGVFSTYGFKVKFEVYESPTKCFVHSYSYSKENKEYE